MSRTRRENAAVFGFPGNGKDNQPAHPKVRVITISGCASHAVVDAAMGGVAGKGAGEQSLARNLYRRLEEKSGSHGWAGGWRSSESRFRPAPRCRPASDGTAYFGGIARAAG